MKNVILKNKLIRTLVFASSVVLSTFGAQANVILSFDETDIEVGLNESFTVNLLAETEVPADWFSFFSIDTSFESSFLSLDSVVLGDFVGSLGNATYTDPLLISPVVGGTNILLAAFTFTATDYGTTSLDTISERFTSLFSPAALITVDSASTDISVVSAPATLGLFTIALAGLVSLRRKA